jgi:hypothetical protein
MFNQPDERFSLHFNIIPDGIGEEMNKDLSVNSI